MILEERKDQGFQWITYGMEYMQQTFTYAMNKCPLSGKPLLIASTKQNFYTNTLQIKTLSTLIKLL